MLLDTLKQCQLLGIGLVHSGCLDYLGQSSLQYFQICEDQLQIDGLDITQRVHAAVHMDDIRILETSYHMYDSIHFTDIA